MTKPKRYSKRMNKVTFLNQEDEATRENAAVIIQRSWKRWLAELLDAGAGVHIRFRLGGVKFPPCIYYKIFTHRPVVDMCANSPKDYAKLSALKGKRGESQGDHKEDLSGWYQRIENNGWRLLSPRFWKALDSVTAEDNLKVKEFHYSKVQKKQDVEKRRKKRKIEWLKKMYYGESLQVKTLDPVQTFLIQRSAEGLIACLGDEGLDGVLEWEVDEMLKWTNALNYEEYVKQWKQLGTSKLSEDYSGFWFTERYKPPEIQEAIPSEQKTESHEQKPGLGKKSSLRKSTSINRISSFLS
ncbi:protein MFI isoform X2 [Paroedura picta]|uniref:protein MFI isoform X2 n=1 Tax=Paroedura picta TaxID=143630 RepID=UPI00405683AA